MGHSRQLDHYIDAGRRHVIAAGRQNAARHAARTNREEQTND
jgi:hypothetical protein